MHSLLIIKFQHEVEAIKRNTLHERYKELIEEIFSVDKTEGINRI